MPFNALSMICRSDCGACCVALSISSSIPGMPDGKPAGVRCVHLMENYRCEIYADQDYPRVCAGFNAEEEFCGNDREEAMRILGSLSE
jgi:Fe-S-cluster containining protein